MADFSEFGLDRPLVALARRSPATVTPGPGVPRPFMPDRYRFAEGSVVGFCSFRPHLTWGDEMANSVLAAGRLLPFPRVIPLPSPGSEPRRGEGDDRSLMPRFWKTLRLSPRLARRRAKLLLSRVWSHNSPGGSPSQHLVGPAIERGEAPAEPARDGGGVMTVKRVIPLTRRNTLSQQRFCRKPHLRRFVPIIPSATLKFILYKSIWQIHDLGGIDDGLCRLFSHPNITHCAANCSDDSRVMPIIRSSRASAWRNMLCEVHVVSIMQSSRGTCRGAVRCARPPFRVWLSNWFDPVRARHPRRHEGETVPDVRDLRDEAGLSLHRRKRPATGPADDEGRGGFVFCEHSGRTVCLFLRNGPWSVPDSHATLRRSWTRFDSWRGHFFSPFPASVSGARRYSKPQGRVRLPGGGPRSHHVLGV
jgi:hypothetical protein